MPVIFQFVGDRIFAIRFCNSPKSTPALIQ
jgi:hypothetical protein